MTNKMAYGVLTYELGSLNYGDSKLAKWKIRMRKIGFHFSSLFMANRFYGCDVEWYHFKQELMVSKIVVKF